MKRFVCILLALILMASVATPAMAATQNEQVISPRYTYIMTNSVTLTIDETTGVATCNAYCYATSNYTVVVECELQQYINSDWSTLKTWTASGTRIASLNKSWAVYSGYSYRAYATYYIYDGNGNLLETATNSNSKVYPKTP